MNCCIAFAMYHSMAVVFFLSCLLNRSGMENRENLAAIHKMFVVEELSVVHIDRALFQIQNVDFESWYLASCGPVLRHLRANVPPL